MKFVFVINPFAGKGKWQNTLKQEIETVCRDHGVQFDCYVTKAPGDATEFTRNYPEEQVCFVACGGDGTLNEVITGMSDRPHDCFSVMSYGSGNDFVRIFGDTAPFMKVADLIEGSSHPIDLIRCGDRCSVNLCNLGFDADVVKNALSFKKLPLVSGPMAYILSVVRTLAGKIARPLTVKFDDDETVTTETLLCVMANGRFCGGGFQCSPRAYIDDGLMDFMCIKKMSRLTFAKLVRYYHDGTHLELPQADELITYRRVKKAEVRGKEKFTVCMDGELISTDCFTAEILPGAIRFWVPKSADSSIFKAETM